MVEFTPKAPIDLADPDLYVTGDPWQAWRWLRQHAPVYWNEERNGPGFWALTRYEDVLRVYRDTAAFSSAKGILLGRAQSVGDPAGGKVLPFTDPPKHGKLRALIARWFSPHGVAALEPRIRESVSGLVQTALDREQCDFVLDIAAPLPLSVICDLMGVPREDHEHIFSLTTSAFGAQDGVARSSAHQEILLYFMELIDERRRRPGNDIVSVLLSGELNGHPLTDDELLLNCDVLLVGGTENVRHAASGGMVALLEHPAQAAHLRIDQSKMPSAVEEILRWTSPATHLLRTTRETVIFHGQAIPAGAPVTVWNPSANRDERVFDQPESFDVTRQSNRHLTLGMGEHFCLGAGIARLELRVLFEELLSCTRAIEPAGAARRLRSRDVMGWEALPIRCTA